MDESSLGGSDACLVVARRAFVANPAGRADPKKKHNSVGASISGTSLVRFFFFFGSQTPQALNLTSAELSRRDAGPGAGHRGAAHQAPRHRRHQDPDPRRVLSSRSPRGGVSQQRKGGEPLWGIVRHL